jgi:exodeoxyribonuclease-3
MRIVSWNCNVNFEKKFELLQSLSPNIAIIQECEKLNINHFPNCQYYWYGRNDAKSMAVLVFNRSAKIDPICNENLIYFLPIIAEDIKILGVWAYNHRAAQFGDNCSGKTFDAIQYYQNWLSGNEKIIVSGDFNNSVIWDKGKENDFVNINQLLVGLGFQSSYHQYFKEEFGKESQGTLFHTKNRDKPYHIDYCFYKNFTLEKVKLENFNDWIGLSDHLPLSIDLK